MNASDTTSALPNQTPQRATRLIQSTAQVACTGSLPLYDGDPASIDDLSALAVEQRLTCGAYQHILTNINIWSADGEWIVYDTRPTPDLFAGTRIERVNVRTGDIECLYESKNGAACGVASWHPSKGQVVFIQGPENPAPDWSYAFSRRRGILVGFHESNRQWQPQPLDAQNYAPPFAPGALRGGSHLHVFSGDGKLVGFTYDDELLTRLDEAKDDGHEPNQRNIGVATAAGPVHVNGNHPRNHDGDWFSCLVTRTHAYPRPGSDEISRACEEAWIGSAGYGRPDGTWQRYALAFQGTVTALDGTTHAEVFVADLPDDLTVAGEEPLEGTQKQRPVPSRGTVQRRLTFTDGRRYPGVQGVRHWLRSSPDGTQIAFLMKDDDGVAQFWLVSPNGGDARQLTHYPWSIASAFSWSPDGRFLAHVMDNSVFLTEIATGRGVRITTRASDEEAPQPQACVFSPDGRHIAIMRQTLVSNSAFLQIFLIHLPKL